MTPQNSPLFRSNLSRPRAPSVFWITEHVRLSHLGQLSYLQIRRVPPLKPKEISPQKPPSRVKRPLSIVDPAEQKNGNGLSALAPPFVPGRKYFHLTLSVCNGKRHSS